MSVFNYEGLVFEEHKGEKYHVLTLNFLDYHGDYQEITLTWTQLGRKSLWLAEFSGLTTEYSGCLVEVLDNVIKHYENNKFKKEEEK